MDGNNMNGNNTGSAMKLNACAFAMAFGILWGLSLFITALVAGFMDWGGSFVDVMSSVYVGYASGIVGSLIGFAWGFVDGFIGGYILAFLYNMCSGCAKCSCCFCKCNK